MARSDPESAMMIAVTMHVHGKRPVTELAAALTDLDLADAMVATDRSADE